MASEIREEVLKLMAQKDKIEGEIQELTSILDKNNVGMNEPLVDSEGFPLKNVDVYQVRHARHRIICLQNDHKALMKQIENGLHGYYASSSNGVTSNDASMDVDRPSLVVHKIPFAKVDVVTPQSPAEYSGLQVHDELVEFGSVNSTNFRSIQDIASVVQHSEGQRINVKVKREDRYSTLVLVPKKWQGRGLLGCNIVPLS